MKKFRNKKIFNCRGEIRGITNYDEDKHEICSEFLTNVVLGVFGDDVYNAYSSYKYEGIRTYINDDEVILLNSDVITDNTLYCVIKNKEKLKIRTTDDLNDFLFLTDDFYIDKKVALCFRKYYAQQKKSLSEERLLDIMILKENDKIAEYDEKIAKYYRSYRSQKIKSKRI